MRGSGMGSRHLAGPAVLLVLLTACGGGGDEPAEPPAVDDTVQEPEEDADDPAVDDDTVDDGSAVVDDEGSAVDDADADDDADPDDTGDDLALEDGRHPAFLTELDVAGRTVTFDVIQFLTGEDAAAAYLEDTGETGGPPNDYHLRNVNPRLRTLPVSDDVTVTVVRLGEPTGAGSVSWTLATLPDHLDETAPTEDLGRLGWNPYWLTVDDGTVVAIDEQYLP
jgi:hypothetical protein